LLKKVKISYKQKIQSIQLVFDQLHELFSKLNFNLTLIYSVQERWKEVEELEVQVMKTSKKMLGEEHSSTLNSMNNLTSTYRNQER